MRFPRTQISSANLTVRLRSYSVAQISRTESSATGRVIGDAGPRHSPLPTTTAQ